MEMLSKLIKIGTKLELESIRYAKDKEQENKIYKSEVYDIISEERLEVTMPMESTKLILLPVDGEYDMTFYALNGTVYQCLGRVIDRYKSNNVYILPLKQRRQGRVGFENHVVGNGILRRGMQMHERVFNL